MATRAAPAAAVTAPRSLARKVGVQRSLTFLHQLLPARRLATLAIVPPESPSLRLQQPGCEEEG